MILLIFYPLIFFILVTNSS